MDLDMDYSLIFCFDASTGKMHFCISQFSIVCTAACFLEHFISLVLESWFQRSFRDVALQHAVFVHFLCIKWLVFHLLKYQNFLFIGMLLELVQNNPENQVYLLSNGCISQVSDFKPSNLVTKERWRVMNSTSWMRAFHGGSRRRSLTHKIVVESLTQLLLLLRRLHAILAPSQSRSRRAMWAQASSGRRLHEWSPLVLGWKATFCFVKRSWCD